MFGDDWMFTLTRIRPRPKWKTDLDRIEIEILVKELHDTGRLDLIFGDQEGEKK
jgi:hypothetical protein